jgi:serine/threonine-protein kinase RsbW/stage II sporulation protein AB (anti-sigma F factor)
MRRLRQEVVAYTEPLGANDDIREAVQLAVSEALTNVVVHAYVERDPGDMIVEARHDDDDHLSVIVCDDGVGLLPVSPARSRGLGLGIGLMAQMADDFSIANREDQPGTVVSMRFSLVRRANRMLGPSSGT